MDWRSCTQGGSMAQIRWFRDIKSWKKAKELGKDG